MLDPTPRTITVSGVARGISRPVVERQPQRRLRDEQVRRRRLTHALRREGFEDGVRATALCPGFVETDMTMSAQFPRAQMTKPGDLAQLAEMLLLLPNTAVIAELLVNCRLEHTL